MATRNPKVSDLETPPSEAVQPSATAVPPGVTADVTVKYKQQVQPNLSQINEPPEPASYPQDLRELAAAEYDDLPADPLSEFTDTWADFAGHTLRIARLPDPAARRMHGQNYNRPWFGEVEMLGDTTFDPGNIVSTLQLLNGNSGGVFRLWLCDMNGRPIPGAKLDRIAIGDPPRGAIELAQPATPPQPAPPATREKTALETQVEQIQARLLETALARALDPPQPARVAAVDPYHGMSDEDRLTLLLVKQGGVLGTVTQKLTALTQSADAAPEAQDWKSRGLNALVGLVEQNPAIVERLSGTIERIVARVLPDPRMPSPPIYQQPPATAIQPAQLQAPITAQPQSINGLPETPQEDDAEIDDDIMTILDEVIALLTSEKPLDANDPVFVHLRQTYPIKFRVAIQLIGTQSTDEIVAWIKTQGAIYTALLDSPATGPRYRERIIELQTLIRTASNAKDTAATTAAPATTKQAT